MKRFLTVTILFCFIALNCVVISYASNGFASLTYNVPLDVGQTAGYSANTGSPYIGRLTLTSNIDSVYAFAVIDNSKSYTVYTFRDGGNAIPSSFSIRISSSYSSGTTNVTASSLYNGYNIRYRSDSYSSNNIDLSPFIPVYESFRAGLEQFYNPPSQYVKNDNVDAFLANTLISMGYTFQSSADALRFGAAAWDFAVDEGNQGTSSYTWDIDNFVSYSNAQSNNYLNWYLGYKVHSDVISALKAYSTNYLYNDGSLANGVKSYDTTYDYHPKRPADNSFYPAQTITYVNGAFLTSEGVDGEQLLYNPPSVRQFLGNPSAPAITENPPSNGTGVITDGSGDTVYDIDIDFPSLDWLAAALQSILDFFRQLLDTISTLISKVIDTLERLFSDAFEGLKGFGEGLIEWLYSVVESFGNIGSEYIPSDLWSIILPFIYLNIGLAIIMFVLRSH